MGYQIKYDGNGNYRVCGHLGLVFKDDYWFQHGTGLKGHYTQIHHALNPAPNHLATTQPRKRLRLKTNNIQAQTPEENLLDLTDKSILYLYTHRFIDKALVLALSKSQLIREDIKGLLSFVGYDESGKIRCITKRDTNKRPNAFKGEAQYSDKQYSFLIPSQNKPCPIFLCEGPIDALSIACMNHRRHNTGYFNANIIATCGSPQGNLQKRVNRFNPSKIYLVFDNDDAGRRMDQCARSLLQTSIPIQTISYPYGKDPNDWLIHRIKNNIK